MNLYHCYHYLCHETAAEIIATTAFEARKTLANQLGVSANDIISIRVEAPMTSVATNHTYL